MFDRYDLLHLKKHGWNSDMERWGGGGGGGGRGQSGRLRGHWKIYLELKLLNITQSSCLSSLSYDLFCLLPCCKDAATLAEDRFSRLVYTEL